MDWPLINNTANFGQHFNPIIYLLASKKPLANW